MDLLCIEMSVLYVCLRVDYKRGIVGWGVGVGGGVAQQAIAALSDLQSCDCINTRIIRLVNKDSLTITPPSSRPVNRVVFIEFGRKLFSLSKV